VNAVKNKPIRKQAARRRSKPAPVERGVYAGVERRSAQRCRLQQAIQVQLIVSKTGAGGSPVGGLMLNATANGFACRVPVSERNLPATGGMVIAVFDLGADDRRSASFELPAVVRSITEAGTPGHQVVGLEFMFDQNTGGERERLRRALEADGAERGE
jgi:hypothetical protein